MYVNKIYYLSFKLYLIKLLSLFFKYILIFIFYKIRFSAIQVLENKTPEGYAILYGRLIDPDPSNYVYNDTMKYLSMTLDLWLHREGTTNGHIILFDMKNVVFGHAARLNPVGLKKYLIYLQEALPVRLKGFHFMNITSVMDVILNMMKPFMKKELLDMVIYIILIFQLILNVLII